MENLTAELRLDPRLPSRSLISPLLWRRLTERIIKDEGVEQELAERIMDQALGFVRLCAMSPGGEKYSPSRLVDIGWHTFILYTREYAEFCDGLAGSFIHHEPSDRPGVDYGTSNIARTMAAMKVRGLHVEEELWVGHAPCDGVDCTACSVAPPCSGKSNRSIYGLSDCSTYCSGDSCSGGGGDGDSGCSH